MALLSRVPAADMRPRSAAHHLDPRQRHDLALAALGAQPLAALARQHRVSRRFLYRQRRRALDAVRNAFTPPAPTTDQVLFHLPVTRSWLRQFVLCATLIGHA